MNNGSSDYKQLNEQNDATVDAQLLYTKKTRGPGLTSCVWVPRSGGGIQELHNHRHEIRNQVCHTSITKHVLLLIKPPHAKG